MTVKSTSYPRNKIKVLLLENISDAAVAELTAAGYADKVSPIVGVPPAVTDLDLKLTPLTDPLRSIFLPVISR